MSKDYCTYVWEHKGRYYACGYEAKSDHRCGLHLGWPGVLRPVILERGPGPVVGGKG